MLVLVTGASRGIGLELCRVFTARGDQVIATCVTLTKELSNCKVYKVIEQIDVSDSSGIERLVVELNGAKIDLLVNNAGMMSMESLANVNTHPGVDGILKQFEVNALGPLRVTAALSGNLQPGSRVVMISSRMGSVGDNSTGGFYGYRMSKAALNMAATSLAHDLGKKSIAVGVVHPGMVHTDMTVQFGGGIPPAESAKGVIARCDELNMENSGTFWHMDGSVLPW